jgi:hypothetical protein
MRNQADRSYTTYVINDAEQTYANAYFELNYINVYSTSSNSSSSSSGTASATGATTTVSTGPGSSTGASQSQNAGDKRYVGIAGFTGTGIFGSTVVLLAGMLGLGLVV